MERQTSLLLFFSLGGVHNVISASVLLLLVSDQICNEVLLIACCLIQVGPRPRPQYVVLCSD